MERFLIVNADDFGQSQDVNRGILRAHREGIVTSASLMVRWPAVVDAVKRAGQLDLGLHIDLGEWVFRNGDWVARYERVSLEDKVAVEAEVNSQLEEFCALTGKTPSHIDSHQHVHMQEPLRSVARRFADELSVPLRGCTSKIHYCGSFYGQSGEGQPCPESISVTSLITLLRELPFGTTELACHPGDDEALDSTYLQERFQEVQTLCDPQLRDILAANHIRLSTFAEMEPQSL
jgi:chitin disaccharide deacetylase